MDQEIGPFSWLMIDLIIPYLSVAERYVFSVATNISFGLLLECRTWASVTKMINLIIEAIKYGILLSEIRKGITNPDLCRILSASPQSVFGLISTISDEELKGVDMDIDWTVIDIRKGFNGGIRSSLNYDDVVGLMVGNPYARVKKPSSILKVLSIWKILLATQSINRYSFEYFKKEYSTILHEQYIHDELKNVLIQLIEKGKIDVEILVNTLVRWDHTYIEMICKYLQGRKCCRMWIRVVIDKMLNANLYPQKNFIEFNYGADRQYELNIPKCVYDLAESHTVNIQRLIDDIVEYHFNNLNGDEDYEDDW